MISVHNSGFAVFGKKNIKTVCDLEGALYIDDYAFDGDVWWALFYTAVLKKPEHAHYFGLTRVPDLPEVFGRGAGTLRVRNFVDKHPFWFPGLYSPDNEAFVYSRGVHDFYQTPFGFAVDGGGEYMRTVGGTAGWHNAKFNPETMEITTHEGTHLGTGQFASDDRRDLRR